MAHQASAQHRGGGPSRHERQWREWVEAWQRSGLTQGEFCRREQIRESTFSWWKSELAKRERRRGTSATSAATATSGQRQVEPLRWLAVETGTAEVGQASAGREAEGWQFELVLRGDRRVLLGADFDAAGLQRLVAVLESLPC